MKKYSFLKVAIIVATFVLYGNFNSIAQIHEFGGMINNAFYKGSLTNTPTFLDVNPSFTLFYRNNINPAWVIRPQFTYVSLKYEDANWKTPLSNYRKTSFVSDIYEFGLLSEYNFFDYRGENKRVTWSPYLVGGIAGFAVASQNNAETAFNFAIPIGAGLKINLGRQWNIGAEFLARKTFADDIDGVVGLNNVNSVQAGDLNKTDWYYTLGIFISYTRYTVNCPR